MILLDDREKPSVRRVVVDVCRERGIEVQISRLPFGDFILLPESKNGGGRVVGIERKTVSDLVHSYPDRRVHKQLDGLTTTCDEPWLLVEGPLDYRVVNDKYLLTVNERETQWDHATISGFLSKIQRRGVKWFHSGSIRESVAWMIGQYTMIERGLETASSISGSAGRRADVPAPVAALCCIPGWGQKTAEKALREFGDVKSLLSVADDIIEGVIGKKRTESLRKVLG